MKKLFEEKRISSCQEPGKYLGSPEIGTASWWTVDPNIRSGPGYPDIQGGKNVIRLSFWVGDWLTYYQYYSPTDYWKRLITAIEKRKEERGHSKKSRGKNSVKKNAKKETVYRKNKAKRRMRTKSHTKKAKKQSAIVEVWFWFEFRNSVCRFFSISHWPVGTESDALPLSQNTRGNERKIPGGWYWSIPVNKRFPYNWNPEQGARKKSR